MGSVGNGRFKSERYKTALRTVEDNIRANSLESLIVINSNGDVLIDKSDGAKDHVMITKEDETSMRGATITHNHPSGSTFSWQDLKTLEFTEAHEIRAVGSSGITYSLVRGVGASTNGDFFYSYYIAEEQYKKNTVNSIWNNSAQTQADADKCNKMVEDYRRQWLKDNSKRFGYSYSERKVRK